MLFSIATAQLFGKVPVADWKIRFRKAAGKLRCAAVAQDESQIWAEFCEFKGLQET